ncbi:hypothetical protein CN918_31530 [Priestia megaterium]|nr:hypothetical protein CN918_31530 [Priestia megaterium]
MSATSKLTIKERNQLILKDLIQWKEENPKETLQNLFKRIEDKYEGMTYTNAQSLYYNKFREILDKKEPQSAPSVMPHDFGDPSVKNVVILNQYKSRVVEVEGTDYIVSKDLLKSVGINSISTILNAMMTKENTTKISVKNNGVSSKTTVINIPLAVEFLEKIAEDHLSVKIRAKAKTSLSDLRQFLSLTPEQRMEKTREAIKEESSQSSSTSENNEVQSSSKPTSSQQPYMRSYSSMNLVGNNVFVPEGFYKQNDKVEFLVEQINLKTVKGRTTDQYKVPGTIYIADVAEGYIADLRDYFEEGKTVLATVMTFDAQFQRLHLSTKDSISTKNRSHRDNTNTYRPIRRATTNNLSVTVKEEKGQNESREITFFPQDVTTLVDESAETGIATLPTLSIRAQTELDAIVNLINNEARIGALTPKAKHLLIELLNEKGLVNIISGIKDVQRDFQPDLGLLFLQEVAKQIKDGGL